MRAKILDLPNGQRIRSERIRNVKVFPARSPSSGHVYMEIYGAEGIVYSGVVDLGRVVAAECLPMRA
ncbi:hypothetical protein [Rhodoblastus sp.]|uniref:hypothetical protein n=1 Tax=Rhodoblastus sp. TaxID=1962975 RepID=UPI003F95BBEA